MLVDELAGVFYDYTIGCNAENALGSYTKVFSRIQFERKAVAMYRPTADVHSKDYVTLLASFPGLPGLLCRATHF